MFAIEVMVNLKSPDKIYLMSHNHCGAAQAIGVSDGEMKRAHAEYGDMLRKRFPHITVIVLHDLHSECGEYHNGHEEIVSEAA
jgi:carbonic anhydrase